MFSLVNCQLKVSRTLICIYIGVYLCVFYSLSITEIDLLQKVIICIVILSSFWVVISARLLISQQSISAISWSAEDGNIRLCLKSGELLEVVSIRQTAVTPLFVFMRVEVHERFFSLPLLVFYDSCSSESFRRLKVLARFGGFKAVT